MIAQILEQERAIRCVVSEDREVSHLVLKCQDLDVLTSVCTTLEQLVDSTDMLSGDSYVTVSLTKPTLKFIENASEAAHDDTNMTADLKKQEFSLTSKNVIQVKQLRPALIQPLGWTLGIRQSPNSTKNVWEI